MKTIKLKHLQNLGILLAGLGSNLGAYASLSDTTSLVGAIRLGEVTMAGTGCPRGSYQLIPSEDGQEYKLLFENFIAEAGGAVGKRMDRKTCAIAIPVQVPDGFAVAVPELNLHGFAAIPRGAIVNLRVEHFLAGQRGPVFTKSFKGPYDNDFEVNTATPSTVWASCGEDVIIRTNLSLLVKTNTANAHVISLIAGAGEPNHSGYVFRLNFKRCR
jgi:hypothetical protein